MGGVCYHVLNRGNARDEVFHKNEDFVPIFGDCHLVSSSFSDRDAELSDAEVDRHDG